MLNKLNYIYTYVCVSCPTANIAIGKTNMAVLSPFTFYHFNIQNNDPIHSCSCIAARHRTVFVINSKLSQCV